MLMVCSSSNLSCLEGMPLTLRVEMRDNIALGVRRGRFKIGQAEMRTEIFEPLILAIISLVREQIRLIGGSATSGAPCWWLRTEPVLGQQNQSSHKFVRSSFAAGKWLDCCDSGSCHDRS